MRKNRIINIMLLCVLVAVCIATTVFSIVTSGGRISKKAGLASAFTTLPGGLYKTVLLPQNPVFLLSSLSLPIKKASEPSYEFTLNMNFCEEFFYYDSDIAEKAAARKAILMVNLAPKSGDGYIVYKDTFIQSQSSKEIDIEKIMSQPLKLSFSSADKGAQVLIFHTHASEAFNEKGYTSYDDSMQPRTDDPNKSVVMSGRILTDILTEKGISVIHSTEFHDLPLYTEAYTRSYETEEEILSENENLGILIDVHRDALITGSGELYRPVCEIDGEKVAQVMFVVGSGNKSMPNENWENNLRLAVLLQQKLVSKYDGLMRPVLLRDSRYNMNLSEGSMLMEIGTYGNTLTEVKKAAEIVAQALAELINEYLVENNG